MARTMYALRFLFRRRTGDGRSNVSDCMLTKWMLGDSQVSVVQEHRKDLLA